MACATAGQVPASELWPGRPICGSRNLGPSFHFPLKYIGLVVWHVKINNQVSCHWWTKQNSKIFSPLLLYLPSCGYCHVEGSVVAGRQKISQIKLFFHANFHPLSATFLSSFQQGISCWSCERMSAHEQPHFLHFGVHSIAFKRICSRRAHEALQTECAGGCLWNTSWMKTECFEQLFPWPENAQSSTSIFPGRSLSLPVLRDLCYDRKPVNLAFCPDEFQRNSGSDCVVHPEEPVCHQSDFSAWRNIAWV